ncbi:DUF6193 family natural product biosynthesis protein [Streptomyces goshikiensis]|uniref:DUF6193 family natural product biosynthesis protein n=1 Tax=Streptomyces goshikiensis TaxID=1942 RepID=UPI003649BD76
MERSAGASAGGLAAVAEKWGVVRSLSSDLVDKDLVEAAYADPVLRTLFPIVSHGSLKFSRCTEFPFSDDIPVIFPDLTGFRVVRLERSGNYSGEIASSPRDAVRLVRAGMPVDCPPAISGSSDRLRPLQR